MHFKLFGLALLALLTFSAEAQNSYRLGDLDGNGQVRTNDVTICLRHVAGIRKLEGSQLKAADVDQNGTVDAADCRIVHGSSAGMFSLPKKIVFGDLNGNGRVDIGDLTIIRRHIAKISSLSGEKHFSADVNSDGNVDEKDSEHIRQAAAGLTKLPVRPGK
jgi:hypothetical protein